MDLNKLKTIIYFVMVDLDKTDVKCYDTEIILYEKTHAQVMFFLTKNNKKYCILENIYYDDDIELVSKQITENIIINMKYK